MTDTVAERSEFKKTDRGQASFWRGELAASKTTLKDFTREGSKVVKRFLAKPGVAASRDEFLLNLYHVNISTLQSMLYGNRPKVDVSRTYADPDDDAARVASEIIERMLNLDIEDNGEDYDSILRSCLQDRLMPGLGCAKIRYDVEFDTRDSKEEEGETIDTLIWEDSIVEYFHWRDVRWGWSRTWADIPWIAFRVYMSKDEVVERWDEATADNMEYKKHAVEGDGDSNTNTNPELDDPLERAEVWEIWDKEEENVVWLDNEGEKVLEDKKDPLELRGFYPCPPFFAANITTDVYVPTSDFKIAQDLYNEVDMLQTRIHILTKAVKVVGVYDDSFPDLGRVLNEGVDNDLIPVSSWAMFGEKGGLAKSLEWLPLKEVTDTIATLQDIRNDTIALLNQITGMADIMRGSIDHTREGVGQSELKAKFGSIRVQSLQEEFAKFAGDLMQLKAEIIIKHFDIETIAERANIQYMPEAQADPELYMKALELLKDPNALRIRVAVRPESVAMVDYAQLKEERTDYMTALATFMQSSSGLLKLNPAMLPALLQLLQWGLAGYKGSQQIEGVMDKAIKDSQNAQQGGGEEGPSDAELKMQEMQQKHQNEMEKMQTKHQQDMEKLTADVQAKLQEIATKSQADIQEEMQTSAINAEQEAVSIEQQSERDAQTHEHKMEEEDQKHENKMEQLGEQNEIKRENNSG